MHTHLCIHTCIRTYKFMDVFCTYLFIFIDMCIHTCTNPSTDYTPGCQNSMSENMTRIYIYIYIYIYVYRCQRVCAGVYTHTCTVYTHLHTLFGSGTHQGANFHFTTVRHVCMYIYIYIFAYKYICIHKYVYKRTCTIPSATVHTRIPNSIL